jgi:hypothetical protein
MAKKKAAKGNGRTAWLDPGSDAPLIGQYAERLGSFLEAMADGHIDASELKAQQDRVAALMKTVEPKLDDALHAEVTQLLCELSAYNIMHTLHQLMAAQPKTKFRG